MTETFPGETFVKAMIDKTDFLPNVANPIGKEIGTALANLVHIAFFPINYAGQKIRLYEAKQIPQFIEDINDAVKNIPEEDLTMPRLSVAGSAMENAKYCLDEEPLRKMFANCIASAIDSRKQPYVRQSFAEIIKQLEPIDADNLKYFSRFCSKKSYKDIISLPVEFPCVNYVAKKTNSTLIIIPNVFFSEETDNDCKMQSASITNLIRLGLITCTYDSYFVDDSKYELYRKLPEYIILSQSVTDDLSFEIQKGTLTITPLGRDFIKTCVS